MAQPMDRPSTTSIPPHPQLHPVEPAAPAESPRPTWSLETLRGRLCELVSHGRTPLLSASMLLLHQAQREAQPAAWIAAGAAPFYPPDVAASGIDLGALPTVRTRDLKSGLRVTDTPVDASC